MPEAIRPPSASYRFRQLKEDRNVLTLIYKLPRNHSADSFVTLIGVSHTLSASLEFMRTTLSACILISLLTLNWSVGAQGINNTSAERNIKSNNYARVSYDNDFFAAKDQYYTQGIDAEWVSPVLNKTFLHYILVNPMLSDTRFGLGVQHNGYTPSSISSDNILYGDQPFAGVLMAKAFAVAIDKQLPQRVSTSVHVGVIGPAAGAGEMQTYIHHQLRNIEPHGWQYQVQNDLVLNYGIAYEGQLYAYRRYFLLSGNARADAGTLNSSMGAGATMMVGYFSSPFRSGRDSSAISVYGYISPMGSFCAYNAVLQGGLFDRSSPYTLSSADISQLIFRNRMGVVVTFGGIYMEYFTAFSTRQFTKGKDFRYGGVQLGVRL